MKSISENVLIFNDYSGFNCELRSNIVEIIMYMCEFNVRIQTFCIVNLNVN